ncbi:MAG: hypothetical protein ACFE95_16125 [Candidatus Hodarchaeota archaeon]
MMNGEAVILIILFIVILIIISLATRKSSAKSIRRAYDLEQQGQYLDALDIYARHSLEEAANLVLRTPEASQILVLRRLQKRYPLQRIEKTFIQLARSYLMKNDPRSAANAFVLAKKPFAAAKVYIDAGGLDFVPAAIQILDKNAPLIHNRNQAIRNLARHAYNNRKYMESAELLKTIGAEEEANTVLIAAATELKKQGFSEAAERYLTTAGSPGVAVQHYLKEVNSHLQDANIEKMRRSLTIVKDIIEKLPSKEKKRVKEEFDSLIKEIAEYERLLKILDSARDILRKKNTYQAIALYDELLESLGTKTPATILAEAALANEEDNPHYASKLYYQAAQHAKSPRAAESFKMRAANLVSSSGEQVSRTIKPVSELIEEVEEYCIVCRMNVSDPSNLVRCPECGSPAHYAHLAEWLKIRKHCPICKRKIRITNPKGTP